jgi:hypothetical protein
LGVNVRARLGILSETTYTAYSSTTIIDANDNYAVAISKLDAAVSGFSLPTPYEEEFVVTNPSGQTVFNLSLFSMSPLNSLADTIVFVNGAYQRIDPAGGTAKDYKKTSATQIQFSYTVPYNARVLIRNNVVGGGGGSGAVFRKMVLNSTGSAIPAGKVVAWNNDGTVSLADANTMSISDFAGITETTIPDTMYGYVVKSGFVTGILASLFPIPGAQVYLGETPGELTLTAPTGLTDTVYQIGTAEPPDGVAQTNATDLFIQLQIIAQP